MPLPPPQRPASPAPAPCRIAAAEAVNPVPKLLLSFPVPRLVSQLRLETAWAAPGPVPTGDDVPAATAAEDASLPAAPCGSSTAPSWDAAELAALARGMQDSAQQLLLTGAVSHLLQEQLHREVGGGSAATPADAATRVGEHVARGVHELLSSLGRQRTTLDAAPAAPRTEPFGGGAGSNRIGGSGTRDGAARLRVPLTRVPKSHCWARGDETAAAAPAALQPSRFNEVDVSGGARGGGAWADFSSTSLDSPNRPGAVGCASPLPGRRASGSGASLTAPSAVPAYEPRTAPAPVSLDAGLGTGGSTVGDFAKWVQRAASEQQADSPRLLLRFVAALPLQVHPFDGIADSDLAACVTALTTTRDAAATDPHWVTRAWLGAQCVAHPHFPPAAIPDGVVGRLVDAFAHLVRDAGALLSQAGRAGASDASARLVPALEQLRGYLRCCAALLCHRTVQLVPDADVCRLEALVYQCLFHVARDAGKEDYQVYTAYVMDSAAHAYRCVWGALRIERHGTLEEFLRRLPVSSEWLTHRMHHVHVGERAAVLPLTIAVLAAVQSVVCADGDACGGATAGAAATGAEVLSRQCGAWATALVQRVVTQHHEQRRRPAGQEREKPHDAAAWATLLRLVAEDLTGLLGVPEWPAADLLLRAVVLTLKHRGLGGAEGATAEAEVLRPLAVDVVAHVALKLFDARLFPVSAAVAAEVERLGGTGAPAADLSRRALQRVCGCPPATALDPADAAAWADMVGHDGGGAARELVRLVYVAESGLAADPATTPDYSALWTGVRAAQLMTWVALQDASAGARLGVCVPPQCLDALLRWRRPGGGALTLRWTDVCTWVQAVSTQCPSSMLSLRTRQMLVSLLLSVFHLKDGRGVAVPVSDVVQRKAIAHLARLSRAHPPLHRVLWPMARQCVRDDSARVRESIVPLLLTLLNDAAGESAMVDGGDDDEAGTSDGGGRERGDVTTEVVSSLLHLLSDKSASVVSRTVAALDAFLTDDAHQGLFATPPGASLLSFVQHKLLQLAAVPLEDATAAARRHQPEVARLFLHRWVVTLGDADGVVAAAHAQLATELVALTVQSAPDFPYELGEAHPLVQVLQGVHACTCVTAAGAMHGPASEAAASLAVTASLRRRPRSSSHQPVDAARVLYVMRCAARVLWTRYTCFHSAQDAVACMATLRALAQARAEWVQPLAEVLLQAVAFPPPPTSPLAKSTEALGGVLVHCSQALQALLRAPQLPLVSLDQLALCLTTLLSKYVGPYQQRVIVASCGALCAMITCGAKHRLAAPVNVPYLQLCYSLMNTYYARVRALLPTLATQPQSVAYTQRFLFLLSEFLRQYPGWRHHPPPQRAALEAGEGGVAGSGGHSHESLLAGRGILANTYQLIEDTLSACSASGGAAASAATRDKVAVMALRVIASLCVLDPTTYFHAAEPRIRAALQSRDANYQLQGLALLSDFLIEEDARVESETRRAARLDTAALILGGTASAAHATDSADEGAEEEAEDGESTAMGSETNTEAPSSARRQHGSRRTGAGASGCAQPQARRTARGAARGAGAAECVAPPRPPHAAGGAEELNSGMSTWVFQQFHADIARLSVGTAHLPVRALCLRLLQQAAHGGLLPPDRYVHVLIALSADPHAPLRRQALASLAAHCERHEEVVGAAVSRGVALAVQLHRVCGADVVRSAVVPPRDGTASTALEAGGVEGGGGGSVYGGLYTLLHKRLRDSAVTTLVRCFYHDGRAQVWCEEAAQAQPAGRPPHPLFLLAHITLALATLPYQHESDVLHTLAQARSGIDLVGQAALDHLRGAARDGDTASGSAVVWTPAHWRAVGALLLCHLRCSLTGVYRVTGARAQRSRARPIHNSGGSGAALMPSGGAAAHRAATAELAAKLDLLVCTLRPVLEAATTPASEAGASAAADAWRAVADALEAALLAESAADLVGDVGRGTAPRKRARGGGATAAGGGRLQRHGAGASARPRRRLRQSSTSPDTTASSDATSVESAASSQASESTSGSSASRAASSSVGQQRTPEASDLDEV